LVHIEGGLGSQIFGVISFWERQERYGVSVAKCDLSYFTSQNRGDLWNWQLHRYQIGLKDLQGYESVTIGNILKLKSDFLSEFEINSGYWIQARKKYLDRFYFDPMLLNDFRKKFAEFEDVHSYGAVHIRRGDYLKVASKVIEFNEYLELLISIQKLIPKDLLIISDSPLHEREIEKVKQDTIRKHGKNAWIEVEALKAKMQKEREEENKLIDKDRQKQIQVFWWCMTASALITYFFKLYKI
jgi:hypothetical protein